MGTVRERKIQTIILRTINDYDPAPWTTIRDEIAEEVIVGDWMEVRNIMQGLINAKYIKRVDNIHVELYTR